MYCVDLGESFQMSIYMQKSASIQPRTSPPKFQISFPSGQFSFALQSHRLHGRVGNDSAFNSHPVRAKQKFRVLNYHAFAKQIGPRKRDMTFSVPSKMHTGALGSRLPHLCEVSPTCEKRSLQPSSAHRAIPHCGRLKPAVNGSCFK